MRYRCNGGFIQFFSFAIYCFIQVKSKIFWLRSQQPPADKNFSILISYCHYTSVKRLHHSLGSDINSNYGKYDQRNGEKKYFPEKLHSRQSIELKFSTPLTPTILLYPENRTCK